MSRRQARLNTKKDTSLDRQRANDVNNGVQGMRKIVKGGIVKWVPIKKK